MVSLLVPELPAAAINNTPWSPAALMESLIAWLNPPPPHELFTATKFTPWFTFRSTR